MIITIDAGNTNIKITAFRGGVCGDIKRFPTQHFSASSSHENTEYRQFLSLLFQLINTEETVESVVVASVVPSLTSELIWSIEKYFDIESLVVGPQSKTGLKFKRVEQAEIGVDRLANCVAAHDEHAGDLIVVDYGTATKYDVISADGEFITGITAPGLETRANALFERAELLKSVPLAFPPSILATNTVESVQSGIMFGKIGETEYIIDRLKEELSLSNATVIATGGLAGVIVSGTDYFDKVDSTLTLKGLYLLWKMTTHP